MRGISLKQRWGKIERDVANVISNATGVIIISSDNKSFKFVENENPRLGILAIIGPAQGFGQEFGKALLAEIGIAQSRPYHEARGLNRQPGQSDLPMRGKWFNLSAEQYCLVAPFVFKFILEKAQEKIKKWKSPHFCLPVVKKYWTHKHKRIVYKNKEWINIYMGTRFSISVKDKFFLRDIYWAELNLNELLARKIYGLGCFIDKRVNYYRYHAPYKGKRPFKELTAARDIEDGIADLPLYLRKELFKKLPQGKKTLFYLEIQDLFALASAEPIEQQLAKEAKNLPDPEKRLENIQLRVTTGLDKNKDYIVVEVFPPKESLDEIPF